MMEEGFLQALALARGNGAYKRAKHGDAKGSAAIMDLGSCMLETVDTLEGVGVYPSELGDYPATQHTVGGSKVKAAHAMQAHPLNTVPFNSAWANQLVKEQGEAAAEAEAARSCLAPGTALLDGVTEAARRAGEARERQRIDGLSMADVKAAIDVRAQRDFTQLVDAGGNDTSLQQWALMASFNAEVQANPPRREDERLITATSHFLN